VSEPWNVPGVPWKTESAFYGWVRGQLRKGWTRHPVKNLLIQNNRFKKDNGKGRKTWHLECSICKEDTPQTKIQIDHIHPAGSLKTTEDIGKFVERLYFVTFDTIRPVCIPCHEVVTFAERRGISFDEAKIEKACVKIMALSVHKLTLMLKKHGYVYTKPKKSNIGNVRRIVRDGL
jgi:hypothetical protein